MHDLNEPNLMLFRLPTFAHVWQERNNGHHIERTVTLPIAQGKPAWVQNTVEFCHGPGFPCRSTALSRGGASTRRTETGRRGVADNSASANRTRYRVSGAVTAGVKGKF